MNSFPTDTPSSPMQGPSEAHTAQVSHLRAQGNAFFKKNKFLDAVECYTQAIDLALARAPWEPAAQSRDETVILLCNRSSAQFALKAYPESLVDAQTVVELKEPWSKGYFRVCKALQAMGRLEEAKSAIQIGVRLDRDSDECQLLLNEIEEAIDRGLEGVHQR